MDEPNAVWTVDFKGQFKMLNGRYCYPLTIQDGFSRFLLECRGLYSTSIELAKPVFIKVFREFGVPAVIRSDNGTPFASIGLARLTRRPGIVPGSGSRRRSDAECIGQVLEQRSGSVLLRRAQEHEPVTRAQEQLQVAEHAGMGVGQATPRRPGPA